VNIVPQVSIAIRAFRRRWLREAIESVLSQTHADLELVIYDDSGDLADIVDGYAADPRVRYHRAEPRGGPSGRFRAAVSLCRGEYIGVLDDDDRYEPQFVARLLAALRAEPAAGVAFCRGAWELDGRRVLAADPWPEGVLAGAAVKLLECRLSVQPSRMLIRSAALEAAQRRQPIPDDVAPDLWVNIRTAVDGWAHVLVGEHLVVQRWHADQLSRRDEGDIPVATLRALVIDDPALDRVRRATLARQLVRRALFRLRASRREAARADLREARCADASAFMAVRRALGIAARVPLAGPLAARAGLALPWLRRRRALPPGARGRDDMTGQIGRDAATLALGSIPAQALLVASAPLLTRFFTPAEVGAAGVLIGVLTFSALLACLRFDVAIALARDARETAALCAVSLLAGTAVTAALGLAVATFAQPLLAAANVAEMAAYAWLVPVHAAIATIGLVAAGLLVRQRLYAGLARARLAQAASQSAVQIGAGAAGAAAGWIAIGATAGAAAHAVTAFAATRRVLRSRVAAETGRASIGIAARTRGALADAPGAARRWARFVSWSSIATALQGATAAVVPGLIAALHGPAAAGLFVLAQRLLTAPVALGSEAIASAWFGTAAEIVRSARGGLREPLRAITRALATGGGLALLVVLLVGAPLFGTIFGAAWREGGTLLLVLAPLSASLLVAIPAGQALQALGRTDLLTAVSAARLAAGVGTLLAADALGWSLEAGLAAFAVAGAAISTVLMAVAWRLAR